MNQTGVASTASRRQAFRKREDVTNQFRVYGVVDVKARGHTRQLPTPKVQLPKKTAESLDLFGSWSFGGWQFAGLCHRPSVPDGCVEHVAGQGDEFVKPKGLEAQFGAE